MTRIELFLALAQSQQQPGGPIIVKIEQPAAKSELSGLADVLLGSLGLTGVIVIARCSLVRSWPASCSRVRSRQD